MKFDFVVGNPPYNFPKVDGKSSGNVLWPEFVRRSDNVFLKEGGRLVFVHPPLWRKPVDENSNVDLRENLSSLEYLSINSSEKGKEVFEANTSFDWYVNRKGIKEKETVLSDANDKKHTLNLEEWPFIPNEKFDLIGKLTEGKEKQEVIFDSSYHASLDFVTNQKDNIHKHPVVHSTSKTNRNIKYSSKNNRGHFGVSKVIVGESGVGEPIVDLEGEYGMTQGGIGLVVENKEEAEKVYEALKSEKFQEVVEACQWSGFRIDHRLFCEMSSNWYDLL